MTVKERLFVFIKKKNLNPSAFEKACGLSNGYLRQLRNTPSISKIESIISVFPDLNPDWLLKGEGEMLNAEKHTARRENLIPLYDAETTGGFDGRISSSVEAASVKGYINAGGWFAGRETAAIRHTGDSMAEYPNGCILAVREVLDMHLLVPGKNYVIETDEYRITKRMQLGSSPDTISLYSTNRETYADGRLVYEPFEISKSDIRRIFFVLGYIVNEHGETSLVK